jgi:cytidine deaminase
MQGMILKKDAAFMTNPVFVPECRFYTAIDAAEMRSWLMDLRQRAYTPGSGFKVANILATKSRSGFLCFGGVNVECLDHRQTVHAEESAIAFMVAALGRNAVIHEAWTLGAPAVLTGPAPGDPAADIETTPCGNCRQQIMGLAAHRQIRLHSLSLNGRDETKTIGYLLPDDFQFRNFLPAAVQERARAETFIAPDSVADATARVLRQGAQDNSEILHWLQSLDSIDYASNIGQSVIISLSNGVHVAGVKVENAAFTGINAMQAALGIATTHFGKIGVRAIYTLSKSRRPDMQDDDLIYPLSLPSLQGLNEFIEGLQTPVTLFTPSGLAVTLPYEDAGRVYSSFAVPAYRIVNGTLTAA